MCVVVDVISNVTMKYLHLIDFRYYLLEMIVMVNVHVNVNVKVLILLKTKIYNF